MNIKKKIKARSGCHELLEQLNAQGYRCWLLTNADQAGLQLKLENVALSTYFEVMISSEELGFAKKMSISGKPYNSDTHLIQ